MTIQVIPNSQAGDSSPRSEVLAAYTGSLCCGCEDSCDTTVVDLIQWCSKACSQPKWVQAHHAEASPRERRRVEEWCRCNRLLCVDKQCVFACDITERHGDIGSKQATFSWLSVDGPSQLFHTAQRNCCGNVQRGNVVSMRPRFLSRVPSPATSPPKTWTSASPTVSARRASCAEGLLRAAPHVVEAALVLFTGMQAGTFLKYDRQHSYTGCGAQSRNCELQRFNVSDDLGASDREAI